MNKATIAQPDRELPRNVDSERVVLGCLIEDGPLLGAILDSGLKSSDFSLSDHRRIFQAILNLRQQNAPVDFFSVAEELGNKSDDFALLASLIHGVIVQSSHALYHGKIVMKKARLRELLVISKWLETAAADSGAVPELLIIAAIGKLQEVRL